MHPRGGVIRTPGINKENTEPKKIISHRFLNRYTVVGAILLAAYGILASEAVFGSIFGGIIGTLASDMALFPPRRGAGRAGGAGDP